MMIKQSPMKLFVLFILVPFLAFSQKEELSLKAAITYALQHKADAKKAQLQIENAEYQIQETRSQLLPQISGNGNLTNNPLLQQSALPGDLVGQPGTTILATFGQEWGSSIGAKLTQNIFNQAVFTGLRAAKTTREFYQINAQLTNEELIQKVAENYYNVYMEREKLNVVDSSIINTSKVRDVLQGQFDNGLAKKIDVDRLEVKLSNLRAQRQQAINALETQENTLKFFMGMPIESKVYLPESEFEISTMVQEDEIVNVENLTEYRLMEAEKQLLTFQKKSIQAEYYPTLSLDGNYSYQGLGNDFPIFADTGSDANWFEVASIGVSMKIPIFTGFSTRTRVRQADIEIQTASENIKDAKLSLELDFQNAKSKLTNNAITINNQRENAILAQRVLDDTSNNYYNGLASLTDLLDAQNSLIESQNNLSQAILEYKLASIQLLKAKGQLNQLLD